MPDSIPTSPTPRPVGEPPGTPISRLAPTLPPPLPTLTYTNAKSPRPPRLLLANIMAIAGMLFCLVGPLAVLLGVAALIITLSLGVWTIRQPRGGWASSSSDSLFASWQSGCFATCTAWPTADKSTAMETRGLIIRTCIPPTRRNARTLRIPHLRPLLRLGGHVHPVRIVRRSLTARQWCLEFSASSVENPAHGKETKAKDLSCRRDDGEGVSRPVTDEQAAGLAQAVAHDSLGLQGLPAVIREKYEVHEWRHACAILRNDFPAEYADIIDVLQNFSLKRSHITVGGGRKSKISMDRHLPRTLTNIVVRL